MSDRKSKSSKKNAAAARSSQPRSANSGSKARSSKALKDKVRAATTAKSPTGKTSTVKTSTAKTSARKTSARVASKSPARVKADSVVKTTGARAAKAKSTSRSKAVAHSPKTVERAPRASASRSKVRAVAKSAKEASKSSRASDVERSSDRKKAAAIKASSKNASRVKQAEVAKKAAPTVKRSEKKVASTKSPSTKAASTKSASAKSASTKSASTKTAPAAGALAKVQEIAAKPQAAPKANPPVLEAIKEPVVIGLKLETTTIEVESSTIVGTAVSEETVVAVCVSDVVAKTEVPPVSSSTQPASPASATPTMSGSHQVSQKKAVSAAESAAPPALSRTPSSVTGEAASSKNSPPKGSSAATKQGKSQDVKANAKSGTNRAGFRASEFIVYPAHGVGQIVQIEEQEVAGFKLELFVINFAKDKMTLKVPLPKVLAGAIRKLAEEDTVKKSLDTLSGRARIKRTMWSRRAQEYEAKINSGDLVAISEVVRDLYRSEAQPEQSYSERQLYEAALDRMGREIAAVMKLTETESLKLMESHLQKGPKRGGKTEVAADPDLAESDIDEAA